MAGRDEEKFRRGVEGPQFEAFDDEGDEHGEPREYHYPTSFDRPHRGRERQDVFTQPYDRWEARLAEDVAESVRGVTDVHNRLQIAPRETASDVDVQGPESHSGSGFLTENREAPRTRPR